MAEAAENEVTVPSREEIENTTEEKVEVTLSPSEERARSSGWMPLDEWEDAGKDPGDWVSAEVFNVRGEFFDKLSRKNKEIDGLHSAIEDLKRMHGKIAEKERQKLMADLKKAKARAMENDDFDAVVDIDEKMDEVKNTAQENVNTPRPDPQFTQAFESWRDNNKWYESNQKARLYADALGVQLAQQGLHYSEVFKRVSEDVKETFPQLFTNPNRSKTTVDGGNASQTSGRSSSKSKFSFADLNDDQKAACRTYEKLGVLTRDEYIKTLADAGELG